MAGFVYFLPGRQGTITAEEIAGAGLGHILDPQRQFTANECRGFGPTGGTGLVVADTKTVRRIGYYEKVQKWCAVPGDDPCCWVGFDTTEPPDPALDLTRTRFLDGNMLELGDGHVWFVPIVRGWVLPKEHEALAFMEMLPRAWALDRDGKLRGSNVCESLRSINEVGAAYFEHLGCADLGAGTDSDPDEFPHLRQGAVDLIAANYTVSAAELVLIGALDDQHAVQVFNAAIDLPRVLEWIKKKRRSLMRSSTGNGSTTASGLGESPRADTGQPSETLLPTQQA